LLAACFQNKLAPYEAGVEETQVVRPELANELRKKAYATIKGFEVMRMLRKGQFDMWTRGQEWKGEIRLIERQFDIYSTL
jgi:hypothetical protein